MATKARLTAEDLWRMGSGDLRRELVNGEVIEMPPVGGTHGKSTLSLGYWMVHHVRTHGGGEVVGGDVGFVLNLASDPERVRAPDLAFISVQRLPGGKLPRKFIRCAPDLAVEVLSPSEDPNQVQAKVRDYLEAGTRLVWVIAPEANTATIYRPDGSARLVREQESLEGEDVLPGLSIPLTELLD